MTCNIATRLAHLAASQGVCVHVWEGRCGAWHVSVRLCSKWHLALGDTCSAPPLCSVSTASWDLLIWPLWRC